MITGIPIVAVYGGANIDIQARSHSPYRQGDSNPGSSSMSLGGVGRNIAENVARLGLKTELVTVLGSDEMASMLIADCSQVGIELGNSLVLPDVPTSRYVCLLDADGSLVGAVAAMDGLERFGPRELAERYGPGDAADVVVIDANLPEATIAAAVLRWKDKPLILDTVSVTKAARAAPVVGGFALVKPNRKEAKVLLGLDPDDDYGMPSLVFSAKELLALGVSEVFISLAADGMLWANSGGMGIVRPIDLPVINVSGAGDAATAALAWATAQGVDSVRKASLAVAASSLCASTIDAVSKDMNADNLLRLSKGVRNESIS
ncbi:MAG: PfkB family carbohydrate kinase [Spirochaetia bacterium]|jgi:pseudouridine kinase|nr:PfkB family carbohydrate kinase [Spirochaetia bacterium]